VKKERANVLFIMTDDQGPWALGAAGNDEIKTPNLDSLSESGVRFDNFFCASPVCSPARASVLTGRIPSQHGVHDWIRGGNVPGEGEGEGGLEPKETTAPKEYLKGQSGYTDRLAEAGYTCGISGKWHLGDSLRPQKGFSSWYVHQKGGGPYYGAPMVREGEMIREEKYVTEAITDGGLRFLEEVGKEESPFYLSVHYTAPHSPWDEDQHPDEYLKIYEDCPFDSIPEEPMHPWQINSAPWGRGERRRELLQGYFAAVTAMDENVGRLLDKLESLGIREETLIVFMSDNGMNMGHHGIFGKGNGTFPLNMFDTSVKVPLIMAGPNLPAGETRNQLLSQYDFRPTLLELLGIEDKVEGPSPPGRSFVPILRGGEGPGRDRVVVFDEYGPVRMIRGESWKYVHRYPYGPNELYDLEGDPGERNNLLEEEGEEFVRRAEKMRYELEEWFQSFVNPEIDGAREAVYGRGQVDFAGTWGEDREKKTHDEDWEYLKE